MRAQFPPFGRQAAPEHAYRAPEVRTEAAAPITDREAKLRTLKHYLYHAGLLVDELLSADCHAVPQLSGDSFARDRDATGA